MVDAKITKKSNKTVVVSIRASWWSRLLFIAGGITIALVLLFSVPKPHLGPFIYSLCVIIILVSIAYTYRARSFLFDIASNLARYKFIWAGIVLSKAMYRINTAKLIKEEHKYDKYDKDDASVSTSYSLYRLYVADDRGKEYLLAVGSDEADINHFIDELLKYVPLEKPDGMRTSTSVDSY